MQIGVVFIPDHGIQGVDHFIGQCQRGTPDSCEKQRRRDPINQIFGNGFDGGPGKSVFIIAIDIPTDDHGNFFFGRLNLLFLQALFNFHGGVI